MASTASFKFAILDNNLLDSSMGSTQGLLSFMTDASRQIKTYLGDSDLKAQKKQRHQKFLQQLSELNSHTTLIPDIAQIPNLNFTTTPASPTPSLDSVGSVEDDTRSSCLMNSNKRKRTHMSPSPTTYDCKKSRQESYFNFAKKQFYHADINLTYLADITTCHSFDADSRYDSMNSSVPSPSPDFDDLVDCMLTENLIAPINLNDYIIST